MEQPLFESCHARPRHAQACDRYGASNLTVRRSNLSGGGTAVYVTSPGAARYRAGDLLNESEDLVVHAFIRSPRAWSGAVRFDGFWAPMDTLEERMALGRCTARATGRGLCGKRSTNMMDHAGRRAA
jgi:hypothetical protein